MMMSKVTLQNDPKNFENPSEFNPRRFIKNGKFEKDVRVCPFSVGLRNCIGKQLARSEYFKFTLEIIKRFKSGLIALPFKILWR